MSKSIDSMAARANNVVLPGLENVQGEVEKIGKDNQELVNTLTDMPGGLDSDLQQMIADTRNSGMEEAKRDIAKVKDTNLRSMVKEAQDIKSETSEKLQINKNADSGLSRSKSPYAKANIDRTRAAIADNSRKGKELIENLRQEQEKTDDLIRRIEDSL